MRDIKFRAWHDGHGNPQMIYDSQPGDCLRWFYQEGQPIIDIMQYTGLKDCKGTEIYEGDILYYSGEKCRHCGNIEYLDSVGLYEVRWSDNGGCWDAVLIKTADNWMSPNIWNELEIKGNIYVNPKLLE